MRQGGEGTLLGWVDAGQNDKELLFGMEWIPFHAWV